MKLLTTIAIICLTSISAWSQFGGRVGATTFISNVSEQTFSNLGPEIALHYWLRLKDHRIEFFPELIYSSYRQNEFRFVRDFTFDHQRFSLGIPVRVYPFDLSSDCDCPTFSKQNDWFEKGFFVMLEPMLHYERSSNIGYREEDWPGIPDVVGVWDPAFGLGIGAGLDIGVSDLVTITPSVQYRPQIFQAENDPIRHNSELNFSITTTFRPDYQ